METSAEEMLNIMHVTQPNAIYTNTTREAAAQSAILISIPLSGNLVAIVFINSSRFSLQGFKRLHMPGLEYFIKQNKDIVWWDFLSSSNNDKQPNDSH